MIFKKNSILIKKCGFVTVVPFLTETDQNMMR